MVQGTGWESRLTMFYTVVRDGNAHFYMEPVQRPGLLPTPVRRNPTTPPQGTTEGRGQGGHVMFIAMGYVNVGKKLCVCMNHPADSKIMEQPDTERHWMAGMEGPLL